MMISFVIDVDGVLTDGTVSYPTMARSFNVRDGHGIQILMEQTNVFPIIMSGENDDSISKRCWKLFVPDEHLGIKDKYHHLVHVIAKRKRYNFDKYIAISDDVMDVELLTNAIVAFCPADAEPEIKTLINLHDGGVILSKNGGQGCVREAINMLLQDQWLQSKIPELIIKAAQQKE